MNARYRARIVTSPAWVGERDVSYIYASDYSWLHEQAMKLRMRGARVAMEKRTEHGYRPF